MNMLGWLLGEESHSGENTPANATDSTVHIKQHNIESETEEALLFSFVRSAVGLKKGLDEHSTQEEINNTLYDASYAGDTTAVLDAIFFGAEPMLSNEVGNSSIHAAAAGGHFRCLDLLLKGVEYKSTGISKKGRWGNTPLHFCCGSPTLNQGHLQCAKLLLHHGADGLARNNAKKSPHDMIRNKSSFFGKEISKLLDQELVALCPWLSSDESGGNVVKHQAKQSKNIKNEKTNVDSNSASTSHSTPVPSPPRLNQNEHIKQRVQLSLPQEKGKEENCVEKVKTLPLPFASKTSSKKPLPPLIPIQPSPSSSPLTQDARKELPAPTPRTILNSSSSTVGDTNSNINNSNQSINSKNNNNGDGNGNVNGKSNSNSSSSSSKNNVDFDLNLDDDDDDNLLFIDDEDELIHDNDYMTPMQLLYHCQMEMNRKEDFAFNINALEQWIDRLSDCKDDIEDDNEKDIVEVNEMLQLLENQLANAFINSARKAKEEKKKQREEQQKKERQNKEKRQKEQQKQQNNSFTTTSISNQSTTQATKKFTDKKQQKDTDITEFLPIDHRHIDAIGTTANNIARTLLGVGPATPISPPILPTTPHKKERIVVSVQPIGNHGLCTQFDDQLYVSGFRNIPGTNMKGPVEREGVRRKDQLIRINDRLITGMDLKDVINHLKDEMNLIVDETNKDSGRELRVELEFERIALL